MAAQPLRPWLAAPRSRAPLGTRAGDPPAGPPCGGRGRHTCCRQCTRQGARLCPGVPQGPLPAARYARVLTPCVPLQLGASRTPSGLPWEGHPAGPIRAWSSSQTCLACCPGWALWCACDSRAAAPAGAAAATVAAAAARASCRTMANGGSMPQQAGCQHRHSCAPIRCSSRRPTWWRQLTGSCWRPGRLGGWSGWWDRGACGSRHIHSRPTRPSALWLACPHPCLLSPSTLPSLVVPQHAVVCQGRRCQPAAARPRPDHQGCRRHLPGSQCRR